MSKNASRANLSAEAQRAKAELPPDRVRVLWRRIRDHRIVQWTVGYIALAYGVQHAVILTSESFEWPNIVARISMLLLMLGLPLAMTLAWYHGGTLTRRASGVEVSILATLLVGVSILFYVFVRPENEAGARTVQAGVTAARGSAAHPS